MLSSIQVLRAVAALLVLVAHFWSEYAALGKGDAVPNFIAGAAGVDLFFVISGFVMVYSSEKFFGQRGGPATFFLRRLARIVPLYWATTIYMFFGKHGAAKNLADSLLFLPTGIPINGVGWTLIVEMFFYVTFAVAVLLPRAYAVASVCALFVTLFVIDRLVHLPTFAFFEYPMLWEFVYGMVIALMLRGGIRLSKTTGIVLCLIGAAAFCWTAGIPYTVELGIARHLVWGVPAAMVLGGCALGGLQPKTRALLLIGNASYALYLTHPIVLDFLRLHIAHRVHAAEHLVLYGVIQLVMTIGTAIAIYLLIEKPLLDWLKARIALRQELRPLASIQPLVAIRTTSATPPTPQR